MNTESEGEILFIYLEREIHKISFSLKTKEILSFSKTFEVIMLNKVSQTEKNKYHTISLLCGV